MSVPSGTMRLEVSDFPNPSPLERESSMVLSSDQEVAPATASWGEAALGVAAQLLVREGKMRSAALLLDVKAITTYTFNATDDYWLTRVVLDVDEFLTDRFTDEVLKELTDAFREADREGREPISDVSVRRVLPDPAGWRERVEGALSGTPTNNAVLVPSSRPSLKADEMVFRGRAELSLYQALKRAQAAAAPGDEFLIVPNGAVRVPDRTREVDFLVVYKGRCGAIEVDGSSHYRKWSSDRSKDQALEDSGVAFV